MTIEEHVRAADHHIKQARRLMRGSPKALLIARLAARRLDTLLTNITMTAGELTASCVGKYPGRKR